jgi:DNA-binding FadR family transcriptional regulator
VGDGLLLDGGTAIRVPKAAELVAVALRRQIISAQLSDGATLPPEAELMAQFNVSRATLREAFRILESENLIEVRRGPHGGARVKPPAVDVAARYAGLVLQHRVTSIADVYEARAVMEGPLARAVAERATPSVLAELDRALDAGGAVVDDPQAFADHDIKFHLLIAELAGNETIELLVHMLYSIVSVARREHVVASEEAQSLREARQVHRTHTALVELIRAKEVDAVHALWDRHLTEVRRHYLAMPDRGTVLELFSMSGTDG